MHYKKLYISIASIIILVVAVFLVFRFGRNQTKTDVPNSPATIANPNQHNNTPTSTPETQVPANNQFGYISLTSNIPESSFGKYTCATTTPPLVSKSGMVEWQTPEFQKSLMLFASSTNDYLGGDESFVVGHVIQGKYTGGDFLITIVSYPAEGSDDTYDHEIRLNDKYYFLTKYSEGSITTGKNLTPSVNMTSDKTFDLPDLDFPKTFQTSNPTMDFSFYSDIGLDNFGGPSIQQFCTYGYTTKLFSDTTAGDLYTNSSSTSFAVEAPDSTQRVYQPVYNIMGDKQTPLVTWNNGQKNNQPYTYQQMTDFGPLVLRDVQNVNLNDLTQTGVTFNGQPVYEYKNQQDPALKEIYQSTINPYAATSTTYQDFLSYHPVFYWQDPLGQYIRFINLNYQIFPGVGG